MNHSTHKLTQREIADLMNTWLQELREVSHRILELEDHVPVGSQVHRGLKLVHREMQEAGIQMERLSRVARTMVV